MKVWGAHVFRSAPLRVPASALRRSGPLPLGARLFSARSTPTANYPCITKTSIISTSLGAQLLPSQANRSLQRGRSFSTCLPCVNDIIVPYVIMTASCSLLHVVLAALFKGIPLAPHQTIFSTAHDRHCAAHSNSDLLTRRLSRWLPPTTIRTSSSARSSMSRTRLPSSPEEALGLA